MKPIAFVKRGSMVEAKALLECGYEPIMVNDHDDVRLISCLTDDAKAALIEFLLVHEQCIQFDLNDFGKLKAVFTELLGWSPRGSL